MYTKMTEAEWINFTFDKDFPVNEFGCFDHQKGSVKQFEEYRRLVDEHEDEYFQELREFNLFEKKHKIELALEVLKNNGIRARLMNAQNGHILATSKRGIKYSYYAGTGTIAGYYNTSVFGLDWLIKLCKDQ